jgi:hypothetical protein
VFARCQECNQIVELEVGRDFENNAEWRNVGHWGINGTYINPPVDATCQGSGQPNWTRLTDDELAAYLKENPHGQEQRHRLV